MVWIEESCERGAGTVSEDNMEMPSTNRPSCAPLLRLQTVENPSTGKKMDKQTDEQAVQWSITVVD